jgi:hypothetical protein
LLRLADQVLSQAQAAQAAEGQQLRLQAPQTVGSQVQALHIGKKWNLASLPATPAVSQRQSLAAAGIGAVLP